MNSLGSFIEINENIINIETQIKKLKKKLQNTNQISKRSEIHSQIQEYKQKLTEAEKDLEP